MIYLRNEDFSFRKLDDEYFIIDTHQKKQAHKLNEMASLIWDLCNGKNSQEKMVSAICAQFDQDEAIVRSDVEETIKKFLELKLIVDIENS